MHPKKKSESDEFPKAERDEWNTEKVSDESVNQMPDEIVRQVLRGDESNGEPNDRDIVGGSKSIDTPQGREETKKKDKVG
ncbi:MAG: hypothetical protein M3033_10620 [Acidobacteriota bacterium]|nr:hypothetical protein [Acidobacteriota bacterium]